MKFCFLNTLPWPNVPARPAAWPFPNHYFDPAIGESFYHSQVRLFLLAERCGFDWLALGEDHMTAYSLTPNPALILAILAASTKNAKLAVMGFPLPLLNPLRVAEECAMLDVLSGGRLVAGFVRGVPQNYAAYNIEPNESKKRFDEALRLIVRAWTDSDIFSWAGEYYSFPKVSVWPRPLQSPRPALLCSANSPESARLAARVRATAGAIHLYSRNALDTISASFSAYRDEAERYGWTPSASNFLLGLPACIAESDEEAKRHLRAALDYHFQVLSGTYNAEKRQIARTKPGYGYTPVEEDPPGLEERLERGLVLCGCPTTVVAQIRKLEALLGVGVVAMHLKFGNVSDSVVANGLRLFAEVVRPEFQTQEGGTRHETATEASGS